jgi:hypothetical protein
MRDAGTGGVGQCRRRVSTAFEQLSCRRRLTCASISSFFAVENCKNRTKKKKKKKKFNGSNKTDSEQKQKFDKQTHFDGVARANHIRCWRLDFFIFYFLFDLI